jgi:glycosyltransferase involved in cell wall biosynthesis
MNILLLSIDIRHWGGIESHADILTSVLLEKGHKVMISSCTDGSFTLKSADATLRTAKIRIRSSIDIPAIVKIIQLSMKENIDLIIAHHGKDYWPAALAAIISRVRIIFVRHQTIRLKKTTCWMINRLVDKVVAVSNTVKDSLLKAGVSNEKINVIHNCISLNRFNPLKIDADEVRKELGISGTDIVVGALGKLHRDKGVYDLLYATSSLIKKDPSIKLLLVGSGPEQRNIEQEAQKLSIHNNVILTGLRMDVERMYAAMDLFVLPSKCVEGFGMVLIEAMAMKKPVIGNAIGGIPEIISNGINGILVPPGDVTALSEAIAVFIENKEAFHDIALEGRKTVELKFSNKMYGERFQALLKSLG